MTVDEAPMMQNFTNWRTAGRRTSCRMAGLSTAADRSRTVAPIGAGRAAPRAVGRSRPLGQYTTGRPTSSGQPKKAKMRLTGVD